MKCISLVESIFEWNLPSIPKYYLINIIIFNAKVCLIVCPSFKQQRSKGSSYFCIPIIGKPEHNLKYFHPGTRPNATLITNPQKVCVITFSCYRYSDVSSISTIWLSRLATGRFIALYFLIRLRPTRTFCRSHNIRRPARLTPSCPSIRYVLHFFIYDYEVLRGNRFYLFFGTRLLKK